MIFVPVVDGFHFGVGDPCYREIIAQNIPITVRLIYFVSQISLNLLHIINGTRFAIRAPTRITPA